MGLKEKLAGAIWQNADDGKPSKPSTPAAASTTVIGSIPMPPVSATPILGMRAGAADPAFVKTLIEAVNQETPPVYVTFMELLSSFTMIPDERQRYQAAVAAMTKTNKGNAEQLKAALDARVRALDKAKTLFSQELEKDSRTSVGDKAAQIQSLDSRIQTLQQELQRMGNERAQLQQGIDQANARLAESKQKFETAATVVQSDIAAENQKITLYLG